MHFNSVHDNDKDVLTPETSLLKCMQCEKVFCNNFNLRKHEKVHHFDKTKCSICDKSFTTAKLLKSHMKQQHHGIITKEASQRFQCNQCEKVFRDYFNLLRHGKVHSANKEAPQRFQCNQCEKVFRNNFDLM